jgi:arabinose-5-phosphate isomerase
MSHPSRVIALSVLESEANAVKEASQSIDSNFEKAVDILLACQGKVILSGMGKSGLIARKVASTLSSTGTSSVFLHPAEAAHGDLGILTAKDVLLAFSQSGNSQELNVVVEYAVRLGVPIILFSGNRETPIAKTASAFISTAVSKEACPLGLAPTASSTKALALGDALAMSVSQLKGFTSNDFKTLHPAGGLGKKLLKIKDIMHAGESLPLLKEGASFKEVLVKMSSGDVRGACGVISESGVLIGIITDGDIRRRLDQTFAIDSIIARDIMKSNPRTIDEEELAQKGLFLMEEFRINVLFVTKSGSGMPVGIIHIQDLLKHKIK